MNITKQQSELMKQYKISCELVMVFHFQKYSYTNLQDAINFAHQELNKHDEKQPKNN